MPRKKNIALLNEPPLDLNQKTEKFVRIKKVTRKEDNYDCYQPEVIEVVGDKIVSRCLVDKPNLFEYAFSSAADLIDPRNEEKHFEIPY